MIDIESKIIDRFASPTSAQAVEFSPRRLIEALMMFDHVCMRTLHFREFPQMVEAFGVHPVLELLRQKNFSIEFETVVLGQCGQTAGLNDPVLPMDWIRLTVVRGAKGEWIQSDGSIESHYNEMIHRAWSDLVWPAWTTARQKSELFQAAICSIAPAPALIGDRGFAELRTKLEGAHPLVQSAAREWLRRTASIDVPEKQIDLRFTPNGRLGEYRLSSALARSHGLSVGQIHELGTKVALSLGSLELRQDWIEHYKGIVGYAPEDLTMLESRMKFIMDRFSRAADPEQSFYRVIKLAGLSAEGRPNLEAALDARESTGSAEFRGWLKQVGSMSDAEIADAIRSAPRPILSALASGPGKTLRFLVTSGLGAIASAVITGDVASGLVGLGIGAADSMILDRHARHRGPIAFIESHCSSIFSGEI